MLNLNEIEGEEKQDNSQRSVEKKRQDVREREGARPEQVERQHRVGSTTLHDDQQNKADAQGDQAPKRDRSINVVRYGIPTTTTSK